MNLLLAIFLLSVGHMVGLPIVVEDGEKGNFRDLKVQVAQVMPGSPAERADLRIGDQIISFQEGSSRNAQRITVGMNFSSA